MCKGGRFPITPNVAKATTWNTPSEETAEPTGGYPSAMFGRPLRSCRASSSALNGPRSPAPQRRPRSFVEDCLVAGAEPAEMREAPPQRHISHFGRFVGLQERRARALQADMPQRGHGCGLPPFAEARLQRADAHPDFERDIGDCERSRGVLRHIL